MTLVSHSEERLPLRPPAGATVIVRSGFYEGLEVAIDRERIVIGRGRSADLALAEATISRAHAVLGYDGRCFFVEDLGSTNGTLVNGARIDRHTLKSDDEIQMGKLRIGVTLPD
jgi:pSer/pThr/pTyr-binding forkhead associated (FHA) protein